MSDNMLLWLKKKIDSRVKLEVAPIEDKLREIRLRWFGLAQMRHTDANEENG